MHHLKILTDYNLVEDLLTFLLFNAEAKCAEGRFSEAEKLFKQALNSRNKIEDKSEKKEVNFRIYSQWSKLYIAQLNMNRAKELAIQAHYLKPQVTINKFDSKFINIS